MIVRIGLDIGGTTVGAAAMDGSGSTGRALAEHVEPTRRGQDGVLQSMRAAYDGLLAQLGADTQVVSIGVGVPGVVNGGGVSHAVNLGLGAGPLDLAAQARELVGSPTVEVAIENDVKAAAWGASRWLLATEGTGQDLALLNVGTGLAAGLILDGVLRRGARGMAGEVGHLVSDPTGPRCLCGKRGCLELYASGGGLARTWPGSASELFEAADAGVAGAADTRDALVANLAQAVRILVQATDVAQVVLTGGVVSDTPALRTALVTELRDGHADSPFERALAVHERVRWLPADYPAGAVGAALLPPRGAEESAWRS